MVGSLTPPVPQRRGSGRSGIVFGALSLLVMAALIPALHPPQPPVPPTAAYAPEAAQNPLNAPNNQSADNGKGGNAGGANGNPAGAPTPTPAPTGNGSSNGIQTVVPRELDCVVTPGYPPRQVEDTQSPPCVASWTGNNGGSTAPGVTGSTITIGYSEGDPTNELGDYVSWINNRFELYGRKLKLVLIGCSANGTTSMDGAFLHDATRAQELKTFATLTYCDEGGQEQGYYDDLAKLGIISIGNRYDIRNESDYAHPATGAGPQYEWGYFPSEDVSDVNIASMVCAQLVGPGKSAPVYTLTPGLPRKFGVVYSSYTQSTSGSNFNGGRELADTINQMCPAAEINPVDIRPISYEVSQQSNGYTNYSAANASQGQQAALQFKNDGVTTVITVAHSEDTLVTMLGADNIKGYFPEWVLTPDFYNTIYPFEDFPPQDQWDHAFGLDYMNRMEPAQNSSWYWPLIQENPTYTANPYIPERYYGLIFQYYQLLILASGIQMAGPDLTPQTFAQGLWKTHFPNPPSPINEGKVGFDNDTHTFVKDFTLYWYSAQSPGDWGGQPAADCYANGGARYRAFSVASNAEDASISTQANRYSADYFTATCDP